MCSRVSFLLPSWNCWFVSALCLPLATFLSVLVFGLFFRCNSDRNGCSGWHWVMFVGVSGRESSVASSGVSSSGLSLMRFRTSFSV